MRSRSNMDLLLFLRWILGGDVFEHLVEGGKEEQEERWERQGGKRRRVEYTPMEMSSFFGFFFSLPLDVRIQNHGLETGQTHAFGTGRISSKDVVCRHEGVQTVSFPWKQQYFFSPFLCWLYNFVLLASTDLALPCRCFLSLTRCGITFAPLVWYISRLLAVETQPNAVYAY